MSVGFQRTFERHLATEQRKAVLGALASKIDPDATVGEVLDAAEALGWSDKMGDLSLADLADALLSDGVDRDDDAPPAEAVTEDDDDEPAVEAEAEPTTTKRTKKTKAKKKSKATATTRGKKRTKKAASKKTTKARPSKSGTKKASKTSGRTASKRGAARLEALRAKIDADEPMSLDEAAELFVPIVSELGNATMQDLEDATGLGRRKLRFHIGQLVRNDCLERHGMGRGTYYTAP